MTEFTGTPGTDNFAGADGIADLFLFTPANLSSKDRVAGGAGNVNDVLRFTAGGAISGADLSKTSGIEVIGLHFMGNSLFLADELLATTRGHRMTIDADSGNDTINGAGLTGPNRLLVTGGAGNDVIRGGGGNDVLRGEANSDVMFGGAGNDHLDGGAEDDVLRGGLGANVLIGGEGSDIIGFTAAEFATARLVNGTVGLDTVQLDTAGNFKFDDRVRNIDVIELTHSLLGIELTIENKMAGTANADRFNGVEVDFTVPFKRGVLIDASALSPNNGLRIGGFSASEVPENNGKDTILGGDGRDILYGQGANDILTGNAGIDFISGGDGLDIIEGGGGADTVSDEGGGARFIIDRPSHFIPLKTGVDTPFDAISGSGETATLDEIVLNRGGNYDFSFLVSNIDEVRLNKIDSGYTLVVAGGSGSDANQDGVSGDLRVTATAAMTANVVVSAISGILVIDEPQLFKGDDSFKGSTSDDFLSAGAGSDLLLGGGGADILNGGSGADIFGYSSRFDSQQSTGAIDHIVGFGESDSIGLALGLTADKTSIVVKPDGPFPTAVESFMFAKTPGGTVFAVAVQTDGTTTRVFVNAQPESFNASYDPNGIFGSSMVIELDGNVKKFLDSAADYVFS
ncbi:hypothetical protein BH10PSE7_BH10PSE7_09190 [soil metagenome]